MLPVHTPYDGSSKPFTIGLQPLDLKDWIETDRHFGAYRAEKLRLYSGIPDLVFVEEDATRPAQQEVLDLIASDPARGADPDPGRLPPALAAAPLAVASLMVQEDLILMRRGEDGWRLTAGSLCFPSSWSLTEKFGHPLHRIHQPVPGFGAGSRMDELITRMFDRLHQPVQRWNWSLQAGNALYHPLSDRQREKRAAERPALFAEDNFAAAFIRVERQTLRRLPESGDVLFTIRIYVDPLSVLARHPQRAALAAGFAGQIADLSAEQLDYKGLTADRDRLVAHLRTLAARQEPAAI